MEEVQPLKFDEYIFENAPKLIQEVCKVFDKQHEKELMLLSTLCVISGCLPNVFGIYDNRTFYANLFVFIVAPPSSGKGNIIYAKKLADKIHQQIVEDISEPNKPKTLFIPPNSSSAFFCQQLLNNDEKGILFASEADTLSSSLKQEWGNFSDILRSSFQHEPYSIGRKESMTTNELKSPCLSVLLSGTPNQVQTLISSIENGLFSRFCFYRLNTIYEFKNVFKRQKVSYDQYFDTLSDDVLELYNRLSNSHRIEFKLSPEQEKEFIDFYQSKSVIYREYGNSFIASYNRIALIQFRIIMILTTLRELELEEKIAQVIYCTKVDYKISELLIASLLDHTIEVFSEMPTLNDKKGTGLKGKRLQLYSHLPNEFKRENVLQIAKDLNISVATLDRLIRNEDYFISLDNEGSYQKKITE